MIYLRGRSSGKQAILNDLQKIKAKQQEALDRAQLEVRDIDRRRDEAIDNIKSTANLPDGLAKLIELFNKKYNKKP
jgi:hypothetical protein